VQVTSDNGGRPFSAASVDSLLPGDEDVLRDATIREVLQVVFSAGQLGALVGYIRRPFNTEAVQCQRRLLCELVQCQRRLVPCSQISK
jgi:hypothetical protein